MAKGQKRWIVNQRAIYRLVREINPRLAIRRSFLETLNQVVYEIVEECCYQVLSERRWGLLPHHLAKVINEITMELDREGGG